MKTKILLFALSLLIVSFVSGQIIHVPADQPDIQSGINAAVHGDTVLVAEGTYYENIRFMGKAITLGSEFIMDGDTNHINNTIIDGSQSINPDSAAVVMFIHGEDTTSILNGFTITGGLGVFNLTFQVRGGGGIFSSASGAKITNNKIIYNQLEDAIAGGAGIQFFGGGSDYWAIIDGNTISHNTSIAHGYSAFGAGMSILQSAVIKNNIIEHNACINDAEMADGGGIEIETWFGDPLQYAYITNNVIRYNTVDGINSGIGAGIMSLGVPCNISGNTITYNTATAVEFTSGGGFYINEAGDSIVVIHNNIVNYNSCLSHNAWGAGARVRVVGTPTITNNEFNNNTLTGDELSIGGGLVLNRPLGNAVISGNMFKQNEVIGNSYGGGCSIYMADTTHVVFEKNILTGNIARNGAGLYSRNSYSAMICNNVFKGNEASNQGGAIRFWHYSDKGHSPVFGRGDNLTSPEELLKGGSEFHPFLVNNDFIENSANDGGAIYSNHGTSIPIYFNSIFWGNTATSFDNIFNNSLTTEFNVAFCDIDTNEIRGSWIGHGNFLADPMFEDDDYHLSWYSECVGGGSDVLPIADSMYCCPAEDFEGEARPQGVLVDVGADESPFIVGVSDRAEKISDLKLSVSPNPTSGALHLRYSIFDPSASLRAGSRYSILEMYSADGVKVKILLNSMQPAGKNEQTFDVSDLPDGVYFIRLQVGERAEIAKIILLK